MSSLEKEYKDLLESIRKSNEEISPKIEQLLKEAEEKRNEAMRLAEEAMIGFEFPNSQEMYISTKIEKSIEDIALRERNKTGKNILPLRSELRNNIAYDLYDIFGFLPHHPVYDHLISGHWIPSQQDC